jgi:hypothetical protein
LSDTVTEMNPTADTDQNGKKLTIRVSRDDPRTPQPETESFETSKLGFGPAAGGGYPPPAPG